MGNQISMITSLFFLQIPARTAHCNKMMNCSQSKVKIPMTTTTRGQSAATGKESVPRKAGVMIMMMGYKLMAFDKASWETSTRVAAG